MIEDVMREAGLRHLASIEAQTAERIRLHRQRMDPFRLLTPEQKDALQGPEETHDEQQARP